MASPALPTSTFVPSYSTCKEINDACPVEETLYGSWFNKGGNFFFLVVFACCTIWQTIIILRYRTWSFSIFLGIGTIFETIGYLMRVLMAINPWNFDAFKIQLTMLILAPTFVAAAMSITFKHMVLYYGTHASVLRPRYYPWIFLGTDILSIMIQVAGSAMSSAGSDNSSMMNAATAVITTGVAFQAANMVFCGFLMVLYWFRLRKTRGKSVTQNEEDRRLKIYIYGMVAAYVMVSIRCIYRIPEMAGGWGGELMQDETTFLVLDGALIAIAVLLQSILHPGYLFPAMKQKNKTEKRGGAGNGHNTSEQFEFERMASDR